MNDQTTLTSEVARAFRDHGITAALTALKLRKRLDLARDAERAIDAVPGRIVAGWVETRS